MKHWLYLQLVVAFATLAAGCRPHDSAIGNGSSDTVVASGGINSERTLSDWQQYLQTDPNDDFPENFEAEQCLIRIATHNGEQPLFAGDYLQVWAYSSEETKGYPDVCVAEFSKLVDVKEFRERDVLTLLAPPCDCERIEAYRSRGQLFVSFVDPDDDLGQNTEATFQLRLNAKVR